MMLKVFRRLSLVLVGLTIVSFLFLSNSSVFATCTTDANTGVVTCSESVGASVTIAASCTLTATTNTPHTATVQPNTYENGSGNGIGQTTMSVSCNDPNGYSIYAIGYSNNTYGTNTLIGSTSGATIATGTATSGSTSNWAMKVTAGTNAPTLDNGYGSFSSVPSTYTRVAHKTGTTGSTASTITTTYAVFISGTQASDVYNGKVKYTMVHPFSSTDENVPVQPLADNLCDANKFCYAPNTYDTVGSMDFISSTIIGSSPQAGVQNASGNGDNTYVLIASNYSRAGYGFAGWSTDFDAEATYKAGGNPIIYGPNETITTGNGSADYVDVSSKGLILYPVWVKSTGTIQNWNTGGTNCNALTTASTATRPTLASVTALTDARDGNVYTVARLADGKCWMTENLRLNSENSSNASLAQGYGSYSGSGTNYGSFIGLADSENANFSSAGNPTSANNATNSLYSSDGSTAININSSNSPVNRVPRYNSNNTNRSLTTHWYSYGNYYNWAAAIANTNYFATNNTPVTTTSLCPTGWRLPQGGNKTRITSNNDNDFWTLIVTINGGANPANYSSQTMPYYTGATEGVTVSNLIRMFPNNFIYSGYWTGTGPQERKTKGRYWASTTASNGEAYRLYFYNSYVSPGTNYHFKYNGYTVRCIAGT